MRTTRNFRVWSEVVERGAVTKSQKGKKVCVERKVGECFSGRHMDNVQKETHVVPVMTNLYKETCTVVRDEKDDRVLPHQIQRPRLTKGATNPRKHQAIEESIVRYYPKVWTSWAQLLRAKIRGKITWGHFAPRKMRPQSSMGFDEKYLQAPECGQSCVSYSYWSKGNAGTHCKEDKRSESIQEHQCTWWAKKTQAQKNWILCEDPGTPLWCL